jgi:hypothetical protein
MIEAAMPIQGGPSPFSQNDPDRTIPIVLGVTGHLDIRAEDVERLRTSIADIFANLRGRYRHTPLVLLTSLARGADQLVADVAIKNRVRIIAPLPFPQATYVNSSTFSNDTGAAKKLNELLANEEVESFVAPLPPDWDVGGPEAWANILHDSEKRRTCYANAGGYIVRNCHALIALWDGQESGKPSGTTEMVTCKLEGKAPLLYPWRTPLLFGAENGPVYIIHTPRAHAVDYSVESSGLKPGACRVRVPQSDRDVPDSVLAWRAGRWQRFWHRRSHASGNEPAGSNELAEWQLFHETCHAVEIYNRDAEHSTDQIEERFIKLSELPLWKRTNELRSPETAQSLLKRREVPAVLAAHLDSRFQRLQLLLFVFLGLAVFFFEFYAHYSEGEERHRLWLVGSFVVFLLLSALVVQYVRLLQLAERRLDYRALAEALRVQVFWCASGIPDPVADSYLGQMRSEMAWSRRALQSASTSANLWRENFNIQALQSQLEQLGIVTETWVISQRDYFEKRFHHHHLHASRLRNLGFWAAVAGWSIGFLLLCFGLYFSLHKSDAGPESSAKTPPSEQHAPTQFNDLAGNKIDRRQTDSLLSSLNGKYPSKWWLITSGALVLFGGLLIAYCERCSHEELAKQYKRMAAIFAQGKRELQSHLKAHDIGAAQSVLKVLGQEALMENAQWLILRRNRPFELLIH